ncbi:MAG TPA: outer membrane beta-barrel protein [Pseudolabrys sp.]|nr:outer membrane beta-barrel protein [Pseudolabrys sp.]
MKIMLRTSVVLAAVAAASSAQAADMSAAPIYKAPPVIAASSWTGFYAGLGLGFRTARTDVTTTSVSVNGVFVNLTGLPTSQPFDGAAFRASPYVGFNWQFAPQWIAGIEGDAGFASLNAIRGGFASEPTDFSGSTGDALAVKSTWDASLRGRLGFLLTPATLAYATSGVAWQHYDITSTCASISCVAAAFTPAVVANSATKAGWTIGGGLETAFWGRWLARADYRYADFGSAPFTIARTDISNPRGGPITVLGVHNLDVAMRTHTVTFGLAYKFGNSISAETLGGASDVFAMAPSSVMSWGGFYAGLGAGVRASRADLTTTSVFFGGVAGDLSGFAASQPFDGTAFRASPYVGYNWQFARRWVAGLEADAGFADQTTTLAGLQSSPAQLGVGDAVDSLKLKTTWDASLRGRLGFLLTPATLAYATGGVAWQHYQVTSTCVSAECVLNRDTPAIVTNSTTKPGWTAGGGIETAVWGHWLARGEYRYTDFGTAPFIISRTINGLPFLDNFDVKLRTHTVTFGLAYKFN